MADLTRVTDLTDTLWDGADDPAGPAERDDPAGPAKRDDGRRRCRPTTATERDARGPAVTTGAGTGRDTRRSAVATGRGARGGRAQIILITGFALAVTLIALALVMNAAIYTENLATRSDSAGVTNAHAYQQATENAAREAFHYAHDINNGTYDELDRNVTDAMEVYSNVTARQEAATGRAVNVSVDTTEGTNITDESDNFTHAGSGSGSTRADWTLAKDVSRVRQFTIGVNRSDALAGEGSAHNEFQVVADEVGGADTWVLNVTYNGSHAVVGTKVSGTYETCAESYSPWDSFWINVSSGSAFGEACPALNMSETPDSYDLKYQNATAVSGNYSLVVDVDTDSQTVNSNYNATTGPRAWDALYSTTVDVVYQTGELTYRTDVRIAPGEEDV